MKRSVTHQKQLTENDGLHFVSPILQNYKTMNSQLITTTHFDKPLAWKKLLSTITMAALLTIPTLACKFNVTNFLQELNPTGDKDSGGLNYAPSQIPADTSGSFNITTYNIDGFPDYIGGNSNTNATAIAGILETLALDIVVFQEVFTVTKHNIFTTNTTTATYPYRSNHFRGTNISFGDGLMQYSRFPFDKTTAGFNRVRWAKCSGDLIGYLLGLYANPDCQTEKGFTMSQTEITEDLVIDLYNLHMDAGGDPASVEARTVSMAQLADYINTVSLGHVVVIAGDFNLEWSDSPENRQIMEQFLADTGITLACVAMTGSLDNCNNNFNFPDHIGYRNNDSFALTFLSLEHIPELIDENGEDLSDHKALKAEIAWQRLP